MKHLTLIIPVLLVAVGVAYVALSNILLPEPQVPTQPTTTPLRSNTPDTTEAPSGNITEPPAANEPGTTAPSSPAAPSTTLTPLSPDELTASYETYLGQQISVTGLIGREVRGDTNESPKANHAITSLYLTTHENENVHIRLQNSLGEFIECPGVVETCLGYTAGETVTLIGTVVPTAVSFLLRVDERR